MIARKAREEAEEEERATKAAQEYMAKKIGKRRSTIATKRVSIR